MLKIRLMRVGKKNTQAFRVVLIESARAAKGGSFNEVLGNYDPRHKKSEFNKDRILYWLSKGAQASPTMHNLLIKHGIIQGKKVKAFKVKKKEQPAKAEAAKAPAKEEKPEAQGLAQAEQANQASEGKPADKKPALEQKPDPRQEEKKESELAKTA